MSTNVALENKSTNIIQCTTDKSFDNCMNLKILSVMNFIWFSLLLRYWLSRQWFQCPVWVNNVFYPHTNASLCLSWKRYVLNKLTHSVSWTRKLWNLAMVEDLRINLRDRLTCHARVSGYLQIQNDIIIMIIPVSNDYLIVI